MSGSRNRREGNGFERECAQIINTLSLDGKEIPKDDVTGKFIPVTKLPEEFFKLFPKIGTCREFNRALDAKKVDLTTTDPREMSSFGYLIQNKSLSGGAAPYPNLLKSMMPAKEMYGGVPVVFHKQTEKKELANGKVQFYEKGRFAALFLEDFLNIMVKLKQLELKVKEYEEKINSDRS